MNADIRNRLLKCKDKIQWIYHDKRFYFARPNDYDRYYSIESIYAEHAYQYITYSEYTSHQHMTGIDRPHLYEIEYCIEIGDGSTADLLYTLYHKKNINNYVTSC